MMICFLKNGSRTVHKRGLAFACLGLISCGAHASSLGVIGETFPIAERSFLKLIESRLQSFSDSGELDKIKEQWINQVNNHAHRPTPLGLPRARTTQTHDYNPNLVLGQDIKDAEGRTLLHEGTRVNALDRRPGYQPHWIFFNGDDQAQVSWAKNILQQDSHTKVILTGGDVGDVERELNVEIFFDQAARITQKLQVTRVPAEVRRAGSSLLIREIEIRDDGHER